MSGVSGTMNGVIVRERGSVGMSRIKRGKDGRGRNGEKRERRIKG